MALDIAQLLAPLRPADPLSGTGAPARLARTNPMHYTAEGLTGPLTASDSLDKPAGPPATSSAAFENSLLKAIDGVNAAQVKSDQKVQDMLVNPGTVDVQDVTIAMAEANMSLNIARTVLSRVVTAWRDVINTR